MSSDKKRLSSRARRMVMCLREYFEHEDLVNAPLVPFRKVVERTAFALNIGRRTVDRITNEFRSTGNVRTPGKNHNKKSPVSEPDSFQLHAIRLHIYNYYRRQEYPTLHKLMTSLAEADLYHGSQTSLYSLVTKKLGFKFKKINGRKILLERTDIAALRAKFIRRICAIPDTVSYYDVSQGNLCSFFLQYMIY